MVYTFEILKHANIRYRDAVGLLSRCELLSMLGDLSVSCDVYGEQYGGSSFLTFECRELQPDELLYLSGHSSVALMAEKQGNLLSPLSVDEAMVKTRHGLDFFSYFYYCLRTKRLFFGKLQSS